MKSSIRTRLLCTSLLAGAIALPSIAQAQDTDAPVAVDALSAEDFDNAEITVTGTLISNPNLVSTSPVSVVGQEEMQLRNVQNAEQVLRELPGAVPGIGSQTNNGNGGYSTVDLRGLGYQRNLVLLDGNRLVPADQFGAVDLNNIPVALLQRVEVLTGGASTVYGADAVSGVVNFITRKDFAGVDFSASQQITERGDGNYFRTDLTVGANFDDGRGNAVLSMGFQEADPLYQGDRDVSVFGVSSATGVASGSSFTSTPAAFSFASGDYQVNPAGTELVDFYNGFNFNPYNIFQTPFKRFNTYGAANYEISDTIEVYARSVFSKNTVSTIIAPSGLFGEELTVPGNNPYLSATLRDQLCALNGLPTGATCAADPAIPLPVVYRRTVEIGPRISEYVTTMFDNRIGAIINFTDTLKLDVNGSYGDSELVQTQSGYVLRSRVQQALNADNTTTCDDPTNGCVPLNLFGSAGSILPEQAAFLNGASTITIKNQLAQARAVLSGDLGFSFWAPDAVGFAVGAEYREYDYQRIPDAYALSPGELGGAGGAILPFAGGYDVKEAFGELIAPIVSDVPFFHSLQLEAGIRYSSYTVDGRADSFDTTTWKVGGSWEPVPDVKFRGNYQKAVRAPNISELFNPVATGLTNLNDDPCAGTLTAGADFNAALAANVNLQAACVNQGAPLTSIGLIQQPSAAQANATGGGNININPETADTFTVGFLISPRGFLPGLTLSVDYYNITINDAITLATPDDIIAACFGSDGGASMTAAQAASAACTTIRRSETNGRLSGSPASVAGLPQPLTNLGRLFTDGVDLSVNYTTDLGPVGLNISFDGNWTNRSRFKASPTSIDRECVGFYSTNCGSQLGQLQPEFSWNQRTTLSFGDADVSLLWRHMSSMDYEPGQTPLFDGTVTGPSPLAGQSFDFNHIDAYDYFDLTTRFQVGENYTFIVGVNNLLDKNPPLVGSAAGSTTANSGNTFPSTYDVLGRTYHASFRVSF